MRKVHKGNSLLLLYLKVSSHKSFNLLILFKILPAGVLIIIESVLRLCSKLNEDNIVYTVVIISKEL